jgi:biopolymer transport protein TolR
MAFQFGNTRPMAEINVTPMVDVMLVLLVIFMVTAPLIQQGVSVKLPTTKAKAIDVKEDRVILTITKNKGIFLGKTELPYDTLREKLSSNRRLKEDKEIYLHADRDLPYGFVVDVMAIVKDAGVDRMAMVTDPVHGQPN